MTKIFPGEKFPRQKFSPTKFFPIRYFLYLSLRYVNVYICLIYVICFAIIIFLFITINHIISLIQTNLFFGHVCQKFGVRVLLSFCLNFCQFQPGVAVESVAYKKEKKVNLTTSTYLIKRRDDKHFSIRKILFRTESN